MALVLVNAIHSIASVFIDDDEQGLRHDYKVWLKRLAPHAPTSQYQHNRTREDACQGRIGPPSEAVVVAVTNGRLDLGTWEGIFQGQAERLARES